MCNLYRLHKGTDAIRQIFEGLGHQLSFPEGIPNLQSTDIRITDPAPIVRMSFEPGVASWLGRKHPEVQRGLVISERASAFDRWRSIRVAAPHFLAVDFGAISRAWVAKQRSRRWIYSWTIRSAMSRETASVHADAPIWEGDGRPRS